MDALARAIIRSRLPASLIAAAGFLLAALLLGVGGIASLAGTAVLLAAGAPAVVIGWHVGPRGAVEVGLLSGVLIGLASLQWGLPLIWLVGLWIPTAAATVALAMGIRCAGVGLALGLTVVAGLGLWTLGLAWTTGDPQELVQQRLQEAIGEVVQAQGGTPETQQQALNQVQPAIPTLARFFPGIVGGGILGVWGVNLLVGLALAGRVGAPPDWGPALRGFRLPDGAIWTVIGAGFLAWLAGGSPLGYWALSSLVVLGVLYLAQGLAVIHTARLAYGMARGWLVVFYVLFALFVHLGMAVAFLGLVDVWADFRDRLGEA